MPPVRLQPVDKALLPDLALAIGEFLLPHRLPLMAQPDKEVLKAAIAEELVDFFREATSSERYVVCAIEVANERSPVGYLLYRLQDESMGLGAAFLLWLQIDPRHQRKGYATAAFESLIRDLRDQGVASLGLESYPANLPAKNLFEKLRFGVIREVRWRSFDC